MPETSKMDRNLALEAVRVTEAAALSASRLMGRGDEKAADQAAVDAMREALNSLAIAGTALVGIALFRESTNPGRIASLVLIVLGVVGLRLFSDGG